MRKILNEKELKKTFSTPVLVLYLRVLELGSRVVEKYKKDED
jgi:hypothetical protein